MAEISVFGFLILFVWKRHTSIYTKQESYFSLCWNK